MKDERCLTYTWDVVVGADTLLQESVPDFPGKDGRTLAFELRDFSDHLSGGDPWFTAPYRSGTNRPRLVVPKHALQIQINMFI